MVGQIEGRPCIIVPPVEDVVTSLSWNSISEQRVSLTTYGITQFYLPHDTSEQTPP